MTTGIKGHRDLSQREIEIINVIKAHGDAMGELIEAVRTEPEAQIDQRWVSIAQTHFQEGCMALVRAVAKPEGFA